MPERILRWLYSLLLYLLVPFALLRLWWLGRQHSGYRQRIGERFGYVQRRHADQPLIWMHAVSVGEVQAAVPLVHALQRRYPNHALLLTTTTPTGAEQAQRQLGDKVLRAWFPYDTPDAVRRFLDRARPASLVLLETELWPNLLYACRVRGLPVALANARLSARSARRYRLARPMVQAMLNKLSVIAAQTEADASRFAALGMQKERLRVTGNLKFDVRLPVDIAAQTASRRHDCAAPRPIWIAASTHTGEEQVVLAAHAHVLREIPTALLVLAPRHPARAGEVMTHINGHRFDCERRSRGQACTNATQVYLVDTLGELLPFYGAADVAFVGGSLVEIGGHNLLEPAALGKSIISGPHLFNFAEIAQLLKEGQGSVTVHDSAALAAEVTALLNDAPRRARMGQCARAVSQAHVGATSRVLEVLAPLLLVSRARRN